MRRWGLRAFYFTGLLIGWDMAGIFDRDALYYGTLAALAFGLEWTGRAVMWLTEDM
jgi:hypothetical protein